MGYRIDLCKCTAVCGGRPVFGLFNFKHCPTCACRQKEIQKESNFTSFSSLNQQLEWNGMQKEKKKASLHNTHIHTDL